MTLTSRHQVEVARRAVAIFAGLALALALLPFVGTAHAQEPPPNTVCPEGTPESDFIDRDTARAVHLLSIDCVAFHEIAVGARDADDNPVYRPAQIVNRAQMATFIANTLEAAGFELPDGEGEDEFTDIDGTVHRPRINSLARAEIVVGRTPELFQPNEQVTRAAMASFIVQAAEWAFGVDFEAEDGPYFADAVGTTHEENIDTGWELGLFEGQVAPTEDSLGVYDTRSGTRRDQMATFLSRLLDFLWPEGQGIFGTVLDEEGNPIEDATVTAVLVDDNDNGNNDINLADEHNGDNGDNDEGPWTTTTDEDGEYVLELEPGTYDVTADAEGYLPETEEDVEVVEDHFTEVDFALEAEPAPSAVLTPDRELAPASEEADPANASPSRGDINFVLHSFDEDGVEQDFIRDYTFEVENTGDNEIVVACVRCEAPEEQTIQPGDSYTFEDEPNRERVRIDAEGATSVTVTGWTEVDGVEVSDTASAVWVEVDAEPTGAGTAAAYSGTVAAFHTGEDHEWYLIDAGEDGYVHVEYTGGATDAYLIGGATDDLAGFEAALALDLAIDYETDADDNQTHDLTPVGDNGNDNNGNDV